MISAVEFNGEEFPPPERFEVAAWIDAMGVSANFQGMDCQHELVRLASPVTFHIIRL
ncbi:hypothetical protein [Mesorhizobium sp. 98Argb]